MLTTQLRALERDGLVLRTLYAEVPVRVEYASTPLEKSLHPLLEDIDLWWKGRWEDVEQARKKYERHDKTGTRKA